MTINGYDDGETEYILIHKESDADLLINIGSLILVKIAK